MCLFTMGGSTVNGSLLEFPSLKHPFIVVLSGATKTGKSWFLRDLLNFKNIMIHPIPDKIVWFYGVYQKLYDEIQDVTFVEGFPPNYTDYLGGNTMFILDDLMSECANDKRFTNLFTKGSHHLNLSIIFITQNLFHKGAEMRDVRLNTQYLFLFKNRSDLSQITHLGKQLYPRRLKFFQEVFEDATKKPFSYLLIDLRNETPEDFRLRAQILPNQTQYFYTPKYK